MRSTQQFSITLPNEMTDKRQEVREDVTAAYAKNAHLGFQIYYL
ncbi:hypothetical protein [Castellaniella sp.]|nr:hypothetical protein [Castellaniella sp.]